jgi:CspA family cold shock protein
VKWFDPSKGFGFVVADEGGPDILLHANVLRNFGQSSVADGAEVEVMVQETARGMQAVEVLKIVPPVDEFGGELEDVASYSKEDLAAMPLEPARVKWFDKAKGFGFGNVFGRHEDIFIHIEVLRRSGLADLQPGEAVALRVVDGSRGKMAIEVSAWERAVREADA